jgi:hypothetical protein
MEDQDEKNARSLKTMSENIGNYLKRCEWPEKRN